MHRQNGPRAPSCAASQVVGYALGRPAREVLFTAPATRRERTAAKLCLDTLVVRAGDGAAAALFHVLDGVLELGAHRPHKAVLYACSVSICCHCRRV